MSSNLKINAEFEMGKKGGRKADKGVALKYTPMSQLKDSIIRNQKRMWMDIAL